MGLVRFQKPDSNERLLLPDKLVIWLDEKEKRTGPTNATGRLPVLRVLSSTYTHE